jgi:hypothetical protein
MMNVLYSGESEHVTVTGGFELGNEFQEQIIKGYIIYSFLSIPELLGVFKGCQFTSVTECSQKKLWPKYKHFQRIVIHSETILWLKPSVVDP